MCTGCAECITNCHMEANKINEKGISEVNLDYCIGCGVCVPRCPNNTRQLVKKATESILPENLTELYQEISKKKTLLQEKRKIDKNYRRIGVIK